MSTNPQQPTIRSFIKSTSQGSSMFAQFYKDERLERKSSKRSSNGSNSTKVHKFRYTRPEFLQLKTDDEIIVSADHQIRPIILPRDVSRLPWQSGYAECINAGKSATNEDQAAAHQDVAIRRAAIQEGTYQAGESSGASSILDQIPWTYFGLFDGHAGSAVAVAAAAQLHNIISEKLRHVADLLVALEFDLEEEAAEVLDEDEAISADDDEFEDCQSSLKSTGSGAAALTSSTRRRTSALEEGQGSSSSVIDTTTEFQSPVLGSSASVEPPDGGEGPSHANEVPDTRPVTTHSSESDDNDEHKTGPALGPRNTPRHGQQERCSRENDKRHRRMRRRRVQYKPNDSYLPSMLDIHRNSITVDSLIKGALESSFWEMDGLIARDKLDYRMPGGCAAIVSLFIMGKLYVCNAGDCRAIVCRNRRVVPMSHDFTPISERQRILRLGMQRPDLLGKDFTHLEFIRRPTRRDLGKQMYYRDAYMTGWSLKEVTYDDLKFPLVWGEGKRSRVLATIGVTRGFGDHELRAQYGSVLIKPFLTPEPEVRVLDLESHDEEGQDDLNDQDVLVMGTDGLWDVASNEEVARIVERSLTPDNELSRSKYRYISAAQDLIIHSRGTHSDDYNNNAWRMAMDAHRQPGDTNAANKFASLDDISAFVIPLKAYRDEYLEWKRVRQEMIEQLKFGRSQRKSRSESGPLTGESSTSPLVVAAPHHDQDK